MTTERIFHRLHLNDACENIDASVFSGDLLWDNEDRAKLREYAERWLRAINEHESTFDEGGEER